MPLSGARERVRLIELDGLRGLAALGVALFHLEVFFAGGPNFLFDVPGLAWIATKGWHLVDLFFVLSGFIFAHCYLRNGVMREGTGAIDFAWARVARLYPLHLAILCFTAFMLRHDPTTNLTNFAMSLAMLHVFLPDIKVLNPPVWSISVEFLCYALFAFFALNTSRRGFIAASVAIVGIGALMIFTQTLTDIGRGFFGFFVGCLFYQYRERVEWIPWPVLAIAVAFPFVTGTQHNLILVESLISWPAAILLAPRLAALRSPPMQWLGSRSYAIYLAHVPLYYLVGNIALANPALPSVFGAVICLGLVLVVSNILYLRLELPMQARMLSWKNNRAAEPRST